jgi:two-component system NtrC family sensor kinase
LHTQFATWTRIPMFVALIALGTGASLALLGLLFVHALYVHMHSKQLNTEFWSSVAATEELAEAHEKLKYEVAMRERAEVELRLAQKLESVGRLAAGIAHEINTPLQAMMGCIEFLQEGVDELLSMATPRPGQIEELAYLRIEMPESLRVTQECVERTAAIVRSVRTFAHPALSKKAPTDINRALQTTLDISRHEYSMVADVTTQLGELPLVECYAGELNQALLNLVINAAHAIGDVHAKTGKRGRITVGTSVVDNAVRIAISDTGDGIPDAIRDRIFDPFFTTKPVGKGTGQGLAVVQSVIAKRHGGALDVHTEIGRGTTFEIRLPLAA